MGVRAGGQLPHRLENESRRSCSFLCARPEPAGDGVARQDGQQGEEVAGLTHAPVHTGILASKMTEKPAVPMMQEKTTMPSGSMRA